MSPGSSAYPSCSVTHAAQRCVPCSDPHWIEVLSPTQEPFCCLLLLMTSLQRRCHLHSFSCDWLPPLPLLFCLTLNGKKKIKTFSPLNLKTWRREDQSNWIYKWMLSVLADVLVCWIKKGVEVSTSSCTVVELSGSYATVGADYGGKKQTSQDGWRVLGWSEANWEVAGVTLNWELACGDI